MSDQLNEKNLALAKIMNWEISYYDSGQAWISTDPSEDPNNVGGELLQPYWCTKAGRSQFAAIVIAHPEIFDRFNAQQSLYTGNKTTQKGIMDEISRMYEDKKC